MSTNLVHLIAAVALMSGEQTIGEPDQRWTQARFEDPQRLTATIEKYLSDETLAKDRMLLRCIGLIDDEGRIKTTHCYSLGDADSQELNKITRFALRRSRFVPATVDGIRREVLMPFSAQVTNGKIKLHYHHFNDPIADDSYTAPQMYAWGAPWDDCLTPRDVWLAVSVGPDGVGRGGSVVRGTSSQACRIELNDVVGKGRFIPAMKDGQPVTGVFLDSWNYRRSFGAKLCMGDC